MLCASGSPEDHYIINGKQFFVLKTIDFRKITGTSYRVFRQIGPHSQNNDELRHWVQSIKSDDPRVLFDPVVGYRREAEWDDHGETYIKSFEGPDLWVTVAVPKGLHRVSLYFFNKDGHDGENRNRDYLVELKSYQSSLDQADAAPPLAHARVNNFWNGVYKKFVVRGPSAYYIKISKNNSFNTILQAVLIDNLTNP